MESLYAIPSGFSPPRSVEEDLPNSPELPSFTSSEAGDSSLMQNDESNKSNNNNTPSRMTGTPPNWMTDELEEEWIADEEEDAGAPYQDDSVTENDNTSTFSNYATPKGDYSTLAPNTVHPLGTLNRPRVPSSLRFAVSTSSTIHASPPAKESSPSSAAGTFVMRESVLTSGDGVENQLQAAVRALRGPSSGLGAPVIEEGEMIVPVKSKKSKDRLGGLLGLFEPPKNILPPSSLPAPSLQSFEFTPPPQGPRTSWKSLNHFSPPQYTDENTPQGGSNPGFSDTPSRSASLVLPAPKSKERNTQSLSSTPPPLSTSPNRLPHPTTPAPSAEINDTDTPKSEHRLFVFQYDTFTRDHLAALVDEIDGLASGEVSASGKSQLEIDQAWETSFVEVSPFVDGVGLEEEDDSDLSSRSSKRIRLSPQPVEITPPPTRISRSGIAFSTGARRRPVRMFSGSSSHDDHSPSSAYSTSGDQSSRSNLSLQFFDGRPATVGQPARKRDRLVEANALMERIRARTIEQEKNQVDSEKLQLKENSTEYPEELDIGSEAGTPTLESTPKLVSRSRVSPRKLLRRLSSSLEVDAEYISTGFSESENEGMNPRRVREEEEMTNRISVTSASIRSALSPAKESTRVMAASSLDPSRLTSDPKSPARRHFARQPISNSTSRQSRTYDNPLGPSQPAPSSSSSTQDHWSPRKASNATESSNGSTNTLLGTPGGHQRRMTTIRPDEIDSFNTNTPSRMIFDSEQKKWIKVSKSSNSLGSERSSESGGVELVLEEGNSTEEDPFKDFDSLRISEEDNNSSNMSGSGLAALSRLSGLGITSSGRKVSPEGVEDLLQSELEEEVEEQDNCWENGERTEYTIELPYLERVEEEVTADFDNSENQIALGQFDNEEEQEQMDESATEPELTMEDEYEDYQDREESPFQLYRALSHNEHGNDDQIENDELLEEREEFLAHKNSRSILPNDIGTPIVLRPSYGHIGTPSFSSSTPPMSPNPNAKSLPPVTPRPSNFNSSQTSPPLPRSALKLPIASTSSAILSTPSPPSPKGPRSVSFSDGKRNGKIQNARVQDFGTGNSRGSGLKFEIPPGGDGIGFSPVAREEADTLELELERDFAEDSITSVDAIRGLPFANSQRAAASPRTFQRTTSCDATFLTNCSFTVAKDKIVELITDVEPFRPDWETLTFIDLSYKKVETLIRMRDFLPGLVKADFSNNLISHLTGVPDGMRALQISSNKLTSMASFAHLRNLERLDVSRNEIESLHQFSTLTHLREFKADYNLISDLGGLGEIEGLQNLSLKGNRIDYINFSKTKWSRLETLDLSRNQIVGFSNLDSMQKLSYLDLDHNLLETMNVATAMPRLRILRLCSNPVTRLNVAFAPKLRTLYSDGGQLAQLKGTDQLRKLENLSMRNQSGAPISLNMMEIRDLKRLYLSENSIPSSFPSAKFYNLIYLELAMCQLETLPIDFATLIPNVRYLNLNYNFLIDLSPLIGLDRLKKIELVGNRIEKYRGVGEIAATWVEIESIDLRMNPLTLPFYPPILETQESLPSHQAHRILHPDDQSNDPVSVRTNVIPLPSHPVQNWSLLDKKFKASLPAQWLLKRTAYQAVLSQAVPKLIELDGQILGNRERRKLKEILKSVGEQ